MGPACTNRGTASDLRRHTPGNKPKRKHPSKMQIGEREGFLLLFSSYAGGLAVFFLLLLGHSGKRNLVYPKGQGKVNLKKIINTLNSSVCPTVQMFPPCQILPLAEKKIIKENKNCNPKHLFADFSALLGQGDGYSLYTERSHVVCGAVDSALWWKAKAKQKSPPISKERYQCTEHRALMWGKILSASL